MGFRLRFASIVVREREAKDMKKKIHPKYVEATVTCGCGVTFQTRSTQKKIVVGICSMCHPFFTGKQKFVDAAGQVEKFQKKFKWTEDRSKNVETEQISASRRKADSHKRLVGAHKRTQEEARTRLKKAGEIPEKEIEKKEQPKGKRQGAPKPAPARAAKPAPKADAKPAQKPAPKPAPKADAKPAPKQKPATKADAKPTPKPAQKPAPKADAKPTPKPAQKPAPKADAKPAPKLATKPDSKPDAKPEPKPDAKPEPKPKPKEK
jgi:ribosomal protein L31